MHWNNIYGTPRSHNVCDNCDKYFATWNALRQHYVQSTRHHYCQRCDKHFSSEAKLERHFVRSHYYCGEHGLFFSSAKGLEQHYVQSGDHYYCQICAEHLDDLADFLSHGEEYHFVCYSCHKLFRTEKALLSHNECEHNYCPSCDRYFTTKSNLEHHLDSSLHKLRTINCIGHGCTKKFINISALILHAESGSCRAGITRKMVNEFAVRLDRKNVITNPNRLLTDSSGTRSAPDGPELWATARSWNGSGYECCLCYREFRTLMALNMHLKSPKHLAKIYRCPMGRCGLEFSVLSALVQHVERGACGVEQSRQVAKVMNQLMNAMKRIAL